MTNAEKLALLPAVAGYCQDNCPNDTPERSARFYKGKKPHDGVCLEAQRVLGIELRNGCADWSEFENGLRGAADAAPGSWPERVREMMDRLRNAKKHSMGLEGDERAIEVLDILLREAGETP